MSESCPAADFSSPVLRGFWHFPLGLVTEARGSDSGIAYLISDLVQRASEVSFRCVYRFF